ncbi:hypothetical protein GCM10010961_45040 [Pseudodonghicola xiamenensis]|uniref:Uncharacterized protein n=1 Tax=Pseudodonghicola xiamenensis TaxID=337702 RepID=A0A8J3HDL7_9RHOB|nr:hypothetical protein GCM10010961_45040 [Pseudodonghicola xiamenensis]
MRIYVQHAGGLCTTYFEIKLPEVGQPYKGEIVDKVVPHDPPRNGFDAYIHLKKAL